MEENLLSVSCPHHSTLKAFMPPTFSKLGAHIGLALSVCALPRLGACETREWHESLYMTWVQKISEPLFIYLFFFFFLQLENIVNTMSWESHELGFWYFAHILGSMFTWPD